MKTLQTKPEDPDPAWWWKLDHTEEKETIDVATIMGQFCSSSFIAAAICTILFSPRWPVDRFLTESFKEAANKPAYVQRYNDWIQSAWVNSIFNSQNYVAIIDDKRKRIKKLFA